MKIAAALGFLVLTGCSAMQNGEVESADGTASSQEDVRISMERGPCFGTCPAYTVVVAGDGTVSWTGTRFVQTTGAATARIEPAAVAALARSITDGGFFGFADRYVMDAPACGLYHTDAPRVITTVRAGGRSKTIEHDFGCNGAPESLRGLYEKIDSITGTRRWIGAR